MLILNLPPPISQSVDIQKYAIKLSNYAKFAVLNVDSGIRSAVAFYHNVEDAFLYIPFVWTDTYWRKQGLSKSLLDAVHEYGVSHGCKISRLEVRKDNQGAYNLYAKHGYRIEEDHGEKYLMTKYLVNP